MAKPNRNDQATYITVESAMRQMNMSRSNVIQLAIEAKALRKNKRTVRIKKEILFDYYDENCTVS